MVKHWMTKHGEDNECTAFKCSVLSSYRDCLSRQVADVLRIRNSNNSLMYSKSEHTSNWLARVCVDNGRYEKRRLEKMESEQEKKELTDLKEFKARHIRPKRVKINQEDCQFNEQAMQRRRLDQGVATAQIAVPSPDPVEREPDMDLGLLLLMGEE